MWRSEWARLRELPRFAAPKAKRVEHETEQFGTVISDPYYWLRSRVPDESDPTGKRTKPAPEVMEYLEAENAHTAESMKPAEALQEQLYQELFGYLKEDDESAHVLDGPYWYYYRTVTGKARIVHFRRKNKRGAKEEMILDENELAGDDPSFVVGVFETSPDHRILAYSTSSGGGETYTLHFKNLLTNELLSDTIDNTASSFAWASDSETFFYVTYDDTHRPYRVLRHKLGDPVEGDKVVYEETDDTLAVGVGNSADRKLVMITSGSHQTSEQRVIPAGKPTKDAQLLIPKREGVRYSVEEHGDSFIIVSDEEGRDSGIYITKKNKLDRKYWETIVEPMAGQLIEDVEVFKTCIAFIRRVDGASRAFIYNFSDKSTDPVTFPHATQTLRFGANLNYSSPLVRFDYSSLTVPQTTVDYDTRAKQVVKKIVKQREVPGYSPEDYVTKEIFATAEDGTKIPISLAYKKGTNISDRSAPLILEGYGAYGHSYDGYFATSRLPLLNRGFIYAIAHVRGGGEMGRDWHDQGRLGNKKNTFTDYIACAEHLISEGYTKKGRIVAKGASAGGLLMGAVANMRPELFGAVVAKVPFVDITTSMMDPSIPLTTGEYPEWGNPSTDPEAFGYIHSYAPVDNVTAQDYPPMLVTTGINDPRVAYWEPAKWVAKLRAMKTDNNPLLLKTETGSGHFGASDRYKELEELAFEDAFILMALGMLEETPKA